MIFLRGQGAFYQKPRRAVIFLTGAFSAACKSFVIRRLYKIFSLLAGFLRGGCRVVEVSFNLLSYAKWRLRRDARMSLRRGRPKRRAGAPVLPVRCALGDRWLQIAELRNLAASPRGAQRCPVSASLFPSHTLGVSIPAPITGSVFTPNHWLLSSSKEPPSSNFLPG